jgi:hypothetical protein
LGRLKEIVIYCEGSKKGLFIGKAQRNKYLLGRLEEINIYSRGSSKCAAATGYILAPDER